MRKSRARVARPKRRLRRVARFAAIVAGALYVSYLIAGNVFLGARLIEDVFDVAFEGSPTRIFVTYDHAWSFFPGQVWVQGAVVRGNDYDFEWMVRVDDQVVWIDPLAFARRTFRVLRARGTGVEFRLRARRDAGDPGAETLKLLPPILGYDDPPLRPEHPRPEPIGPDDEMWSVALDDVRMEDVREIWIETFRWLDAGSTRGGFSFTPGQALAIDGELLLRDGEVRRGDVTVLEHMRGRTRVTVLPMDLATFDAHRFVRHLAVTGHLATEIRSPAVLSALTGAGDGHDTIDARLVVMARLQRGFLVPGSAVWLSIDRAAVQAGDVAVAVAGEVRAHVVREGSSTAGRGALVASVSLSAIDVTRSSGAKDDLLHASLRAGIVSPALDVLSVFDPGRVSVEAEGRLGNVAFVGPLLPAAIVSPSGAGSFHARLRFDTADATGEGRILIDAPAFSFGLKDLSVRGHLTSRVALAKIAFPRRLSPALEGVVLNLTGSHLELRGVSITKPGRDATEAGWWLRLDVPGAEVRLGAPAFRLRLTTRFRDADPVLMLLDRTLELPAVMLKPLTAAAFDARATIRYRPGLLALEDFRADGGTVRFEGWYRRAGARSSGAFLATMGTVAVGIDLTRDAVGIVIPRPRDWYDGVPRPR